MWALSHAIGHLNEAQVVLEDGAACHVLGLAAVAPAVLVHVLVIFGIACMTKFAVGSVPCQAQHCRPGRCCSLQPLSPMLPQVPPQAELQHRCIHRPPAPLMQHWRVCSPTPYRTVVCGGQQGQQLSAQVQPRPAGHDLHALRLAVGRLVKHAFVQAARLPAAVPCHIVVKVASGVPARTRIVCITCAVSKPVRDAAQLPHLEHMDEQAA